jgi:hypothetical protein
MEIELCTDAMLSLTEFTTTKSLDLRDKYIVQAI